MPLKEILKAKDGNFLGSSAVVFGGQVLGKVLAMLNTILLARLLNEYFFGLYMLAMAIAQFVRIPSNLGLSEILSKYVSQYHAKNDKESVSRVVSIAFILVFGLSFLFAIIIATGSELISEKIFKNADLSLPLKILILGIPFTCGCNLFFSVIRGFMDVVSKVLYENIILPLLKILLFLLLFITGYRIMGACWAFVGASVFVCGLLFLRISYKYGVIIDPGLFKKNYAQSLVIVAWPLSIYSLIYVINTQIDRISLGILMSPFQVGIYAAGASLISVIEFIPSSFSYLALPAFAKIEKYHQAQLLKNEYRRISLYMYELGLPVCIALMLFSQETLKLLYGDGYTQASIVMIILALGIFSRCIFGPAEDVLLSTSSTKPIMTSMACGCIINVILNFLLVPRLGIEGAALATFVGMLFAKIYAFAAARHRFHVAPFCGKQFIWTGVCGFIAILTFYIRPFIIISTHEIFRLAILYTLFFLATSIAWALMHGCLGRSIPRV